MKKDYCMFYCAWGKVVKSPYVIRPLIASNLKRQMTPQEGLLFIRLMKRTQNRRKHERRHSYA